jgi:hypothetical protein
VLFFLISWLAKKWAPDPAKQWSYVHKEILYRICGVLLEGLEFWEYTLPIVRFICIM